MPGEPVAEEQFGPYTVYERLGVGGMATVHRAIEHGPDGFERTVALKRLLPHIAEDATFIKSFVREAKLASLLNHVNIVQIYELGRVGSEYFISMEYIEGRDVRRVLRHARNVTGPPPINVTVGLMIQLCDALDYAHHKVDEDGHPLGLVHRDISPSNLLVTTQGHLKIIDFGIAKAQSSQLRTQTGRVKGKLAYMSPEAVSGSRDLDARSDIWAAGVILHELCTARPLFASKNEYQTLLKVQKEDLLPPSAFNQAVPSELDSIVLKALARDPDERYATAGEIRDGLLALKRQYALQTGYRELASWITWAFSLEAPGGGFTGEMSAVSVVENTARIQHSKTPRPPRDSEVEEAVEVVWGAGAKDSESGAVILEEVPDVSEKHRARGRTEDGVIDDTPTPLPMQGTLPSIYGPSASQTMPASPTAKSATQSAAVLGGMPRRPTTTGVQAVVPMPARTATKQPSGSMPVARKTAPLPQVASAPSAASTLTDEPAFNDTVINPDLNDLPTPRPAPAAEVSAQLADEPVTRPSKPLTEAELFGDDAADVLAEVAAQQARQPSRPSQRLPIATRPRAPSQDGDLDDALETVAVSAKSAELEPMTNPLAQPIATLPSVPVVRFSKSMPPPNTTSTPLSSPFAGLPQMPHPGAVPLATSGLDPLRPVSTRPGYAPAAAIAPARPQTPTARPRTPTAQPVPPVVIAPPPRRTWLYVVGGLVLVGGIATAVILATRGEDAQPAPPAKGPAAPSTSQPAPPPAPANGTVKFVLKPEDAEIRVEGAIVHTGSPWSMELAAGTHQIEIRRAGYKSWVTSLELAANEIQGMHVVLEPVIEATPDNATLKITTTPAGLDVVIDGQAFPAKTPIETTLPVGAHMISIRRDGVDVWRQTIKAEAQSDYEFNPSFTDRAK